MIFLFTDFGREGPYVGQMQAVLARAAPAVPVVDMIADLPAFDPKSASYLLPAYSQQAQAGDVVLAVVDPGVGTSRACVALQADGVWYVGPDNGLFAHIVRRALSSAAWQIDVLATSSATFHGRDIFAPVAATLAMGQKPAGVSVDPQTLDRAAWTDDLAAIIYQDRYGNLLTGLRVSTFPRLKHLNVNGALLPIARTYADVKPGAALCYENANGLWELAVNGGSAAQFLGLGVGSEIELNS
jgi:S-adenosyl-L-methionine hydrolase (adenosine-forming)